MEQSFRPEGMAFNGNRFNRTAVTAPLVKHLALDGGCCRPMSLAVIALLLSGLVDSQPAPSAMTAGRVALLATRPLDETAATLSQALGSRDPRVRLPRCR